MNNGIEQKYHFITFGGGTPNYHDAVNRIINQSEEFNLFTTKNGFTNNDLMNDVSFWDKYGSFIKNNPRFYGYAVWKPYLILKVMNEINYDDIVLYCDCGCELNVLAKNRLLEYFDLVQKNDSLFFHLNHIEKIWTKQDLFNFMNTSDEDKNSGQILSGIILMKKTKENIELLNDWLKLITVNNYHYSDDSPSLEPNNKLFIENRHDQSCLSLLVKKYKKFHILDETYFHPNWQTGFNFPIWALRNKSGKSIFVKHL